MNFKSILLGGGLAVGLGCSAGTDLPDSYEFPSRFQDGESSVTYTGQTLRHVLIADMATYIDKLTEAIDSEAFVPAVGDVETALNFYYQHDETGAEVALAMGLGFAAMQTTYGDIATGKDLRGKIAGRDSDGAKDHKDWDAGAFVGWTADSPDALVQAWFLTLDDLAAKRAMGNIPLGPDGAPIASVYVTPEGRDLKQLTQKFLLGAVVYAQATDDYLDEGLATQNTEPHEGNAYSTLEHQFDEAFGYFGAARHYFEYTDEEIAGKGGREKFAKGYWDANEDGNVDLKSEFNFGIATNAAKRDLGSADTAKTDYTQSLFSNFLAGRQTIAAGGSLANIESIRDNIVADWEAVIVATAIHYINDTLKDMGTFGTDEYSFEAHAKHWSELKGFALSLQFNPRKRITDEAFATLHGLIGTAPSLPGHNNNAEYAQALRDARQILVQFYDVPAANVGDDNGEGGW